MDKVKLIKYISDEFATGKIRKKLFPMITKFGVRDYSETVHSIGLNYITAIARTIEGVTAISECPVYPCESNYNSGSFAEKVAETRATYSVNKEPSVRPDSIWYSTEDNRPLLICEFERYEKNRNKNKKLEEKIQNLLIAYHQLGGNIPLILFVYWTYPKVTPGDISKYINIFDQGFVMKNGTRVPGINGRITQYMVYHCVASGDKNSLTLNQWIRIR